MRIGLWVMVCCLTAVVTMPAARGAQEDESSSPQTQRQEDKAESTARASEESSSKDTRIDLSPPRDDEKNHPMSSVTVSDAEDAATDVQELHPWDPHKAAKDIEVGDFYFKRKNYRAALERYKEALIYKPNDAIANFRLAECSEKTGNPADAVTHYQEYLKILPQGPFAADAQKAVARLKPDNTKARSAAAE